MESSRRSKMAALMTSLLLALLPSVQASCPSQCACSPTYEDVVCKHIDVFPETIPESARNIEISDSSLREIPMNAFTALPHITRITLHSVKVGAIRKYAFHDLAGRRDETSLSIIDSEFDSIDSGAFSGVRNFLRILVHNCSVGNIATGAFASFSNINMFQITTLRVPHVASHAFTDFHHVSSVGFSYWTAGHIRSHAFSDFRHIDKFDFSASTIESLGSHFIGLRHSDSIRFYKLQVALLKKMAFADVSNVTRFAMYACTIDEAQRDVFSHMHDVDTFHMLRMTMTSLPFGFLPSRINKLVFYSNKIGTMECGFLNETAPIPGEFLLANNEVTCDCRLSWLQTMAMALRTIVFDGFVCAGPGAVQGDSLSSLFSADAQPPCGDGITEVSNCIVTTTTSTTTTTTTTTTTSPPTTTTPTTTTTLPPSTTIPTTTPSLTTTTIPITTTTTPPTTTTPKLTTTHRTTTTIPTTKRRRTTTLSPPSTTTMITVSTKRTILLRRATTQRTVSPPQSTIVIPYGPVAADHGPIKAGVFSVIVGLVGTSLMITYCLCDQR